MREQLRVQSVYFWYAAAVGLMITYWPLRMTELGLGADDIGMLFSGRTAIAMLSQPLIAWLSDRTGRPLGLVRIALVAAFVVAAPVPWAFDFWTLALLMWIATPFEACTTPLLDVAIMRRVGMERYGRVRMWGSIGYGLMIGGFGAWAGTRPPGLVGELAMVLYFVCYGVAAAIGWGMGRQDAPTSASTKPAGPRPRIRLSRPLGTFMAFGMLHWMSIMAFNLFLSLHLTAIGLPASSPGLAVGVAIVGEVVAFFVSARVLAALGPVGAMGWVALAGVVRWAAVALTGDIALIVGVQLLHFFTFGVWFAATMVVLGRFAPVQLRGTLQGVYASIVFALGGTLSAAALGQVCAQLGGAAVFWAASGLEAAALVIWAVERRRWDAARSEPERIGEVPAT